MFRRTNLTHTNDLTYLNRLRFFFRWFHSRYIRFELISEPEWEMPEIVRVKSKTSKRLSSYAESDIWDLEELKTLIGMMVVNVVGGEPTYASDTGTNTHTNSISTPPLPANSSVLPQPEPQGIVNVGVTPNQLAAGGPLPGNHTLA